MAHVNITKDLTEVKSKVVFGLTKRLAPFRGGRHADIDPLDTGAGK